MRNVLCLCGALAWCAPCLQQGNDNFPALFAAGQSALSTGDLATAEAAFRRVLAAEPNSLPARANLGVVYMRRKNWPQALEQFQIAERQAPGNPGLALNIGLVYFQTEQFSRALEPFQLVLRNDPSSFQAHYLVGLCYFATADYPEAVRQLKPLWDSESNMLPYLYVLALSANKTGDSQLEREALERMYSVGNGSAEYHLFLGRGWLSQQRDTQALAELQQASRLNPDLPFVHYSIGVIESRSGDYTKAKTEFLADLAIEPSLSVDYEELAAVCLKLNQKREAEQNLLRALKLNPQSAFTLLQLAKIYKADGRVSQALAALNQAEQIDTHSASVHYLKAQTLMQLGRSREAKTEFEVSAQLRQSTRDRLEQSVSGRPDLDAKIALPQ